MPVSIEVKNCMTGDPVAVSPEASALEALERMIDRSIRHLPVLDAGRRVVGVLSIDDLRAALPFPVRMDAAPSPGERNFAREWTVGEVMTHAPETVAEDGSLSDAAQRMANRRIGCLPVVDAEGCLTGMLSETDVLGALATALWSDEVRERRALGGALDGLVESLERERAAIAVRLDRLHSTERELSAGLHDTPDDPAGRGAAQREVSLVERFDALSARRLAGLDRALDRASQGQLGVCESCGGAIPLARLRALPGATQCVACARLGEVEPELEEPFERVPGGRAETGRPELGGTVYTRFGEGQLLRQVPFGTCARCGDVEGTTDTDRDVVLCGDTACGELLTDVVERAIVQVEEREVYVDPAELRMVDAAPYD